jgi:hypothetical protein
MLLLVLLPLLLSLLLPLLRPPPAPLLLLLRCCAAAAVTASFTALGAACQLETRRRELAQWRHELEVEQQTIEIKRTLCRDHGCVWPIRIGQCMRTIIIRMRARAHQHHAFG